MASVSAGRVGLATLALLLLFLAPFDYLDATLRHPTLSSPALPCCLGPRLLVLVTSSTEPVYLAQRAIWRLIAHAHPCVHVVFIWDAADASAGISALANGAPRLVGRVDLFVPNAAGIRPGIALKVLAALREFASELAPADARAGEDVLGGRSGKGGNTARDGSSARDDASARGNVASNARGDVPRCNYPRSSFAYVLKTNLSSFWVWARLLRWIAAGGVPRSAAYAGMILKFQQGIPLAASGAGTLMSADVALPLLLHNASLDFSGSLYDDTAIGKLMADLGVKLLPMTRTDYVEDCVDLPALLDDGFAYHFRVKCFNRIRDDASAFARLYAEIYGEGELVTESAMS